MAKAPQKKKLILIDLEGQEVTSCSSVQEVEEVINERVTRTGYGEDWIVNNFLVYEIKERLLLNAEIKAVVGLTPE